MTSFVRRRVVGTVFVLAATALLIFATHVMKIALLRPQLWLGWLLLLMVLKLAAYRLRKSIPVFPLGSSSTWLQVHIYVGILSLPVLMLHTGGRLPFGMIEAPLGTIFLLVFLSGVLGLLLTRLIPARLSDRGEEVLYERIPTFIRQIREKAEATVVEQGQEAVGEVYLLHFHDFFQRPKHFWRHVLHSRAPRYRLLQHLADVRRFVSSEEAAAVNGTCTNSQYFSTDCSANW